MSQFNFQIKLLIDGAHDGDKLLDACPVCNIDKYEDEESISFVTENMATPAIVREFSCGLRIRLLEADTCLQVSGATFAPLRTRTGFAKYGHCKNTPDSFIFKVIADQMESSGNSDIADHLRVIADQCVEKGL